MVPDTGDVSSSELSHVWHYRVGGTGWNDFRLPHQKVWRQNYTKRKNHHNAQAVQQRPNLWRTIVWFWMGDHGRMPRAYFRPDRNRRNGNHCDVAQCYRRYLDLWIDKTSTSALIMLFNRERNFSCLPLRGHARSVNIFLIKSTRCELDSHRCFDVAHPGNSGRHYQAYRFGVIHHRMETHNGLVATNE